MCVRQRKYKRPGERVREKEHINCTHTHNTNTKHTHTMEEVTGWTMDVGVPTWHTQTCKHTETHGQTVTDTDHHVTRGCV